MDWPTMATLAGVAITAILGYLGIRFTVQQSRRAAEVAAQRATDQERLKVEAHAYERARQSNDAALHTMQEEIEALKEGRKYDRDEYSRQIQDLRTRVRELEDAHREDGVTIRTLAAYARVLLALLRDNGVAYPAPPPDLDRH